MGTIFGTVFGTVLNRAPELHGPRYVDAAGLAQEQVLTALVVGAGQLLHGVEVCLAAAVPVAALPAL